MNKDDLLGTIKRAKARKRGVLFLMKRLDLYESDIDLIIGCLKKEYKTSDKKNEINAILDEMIRAKTEVK